MVRRGDLTGVNGNGPVAALPADLPIFGQVQQQLPIDAGGGQPGNTVLAVARVDVAIKPGMLFYARYALQNENDEAGGNTNSPWAGYNTGIALHNHNILASLTNVWTPRFTTQSKFVYNRLDNQQPLAEAPIGPTLYMRSSPTFDPGRADRAAGYNPFSPGTAIPFGGPQNFLQAYEDATLVMGATNSALADRSRASSTIGTFGAFETSVETLGSTFGNALDALMFGQVLQFQGAIDPQGHYPGEQVNLPFASPSFTRNNRYNEWAAYVTDAWHPATKLTLNLGVRYEYYGVQHNTDPRLDSNFYPGQGAQHLRAVAQRQRADRAGQRDRRPVGAGPQQLRAARRLRLRSDRRRPYQSARGLRHRLRAELQQRHLQRDPESAEHGGGLAGVGCGCPVDRPHRGQRGAARRHGYDHAAADQPPFHQPEHRQCLRAPVEPVAAARAVQGRDRVDRLHRIGGEKLYTAEDPNAPGSAAVYRGDFSNGPLGRNVPQYSTMNERNNNGYSRYQAMVLGLDSRGIGSTGLSFTARYTLGHAKET